MALEFIKLIKGDSPVSQVGSLGFFKLGVESGGGGSSVSSTFGDNDWETIAKVSAEIAYNNMTSEQVATKYGWNLGDAKSETLSNGEVIELQIIGYNHDDRSDGSGKAGITLQMVNCLNTQYNMNDSYNSNVNQYVYTAMAKTFLPSRLNMLSTELRTVIKPVNKIVRAWIDGAWNPSPYSCSLFLLSNVEVLETKAPASVDGDVRYEWFSQFTSNSTPLPKKTSNGTVVNWWLRTEGQYNGQWRGINASTPRASTELATSQSYGVSFAFCI